MLCRHHRGESMGFLVKGRGDRSAARGVDSEKLKFGSISSADDIAARITTHQNRGRIKIEYPNADDDPHPSHDIRVGDVMTLVGHPESIETAALACLANISSHLVGGCDIGPQNRHAEFRPQGVSQVILSEPQECQFVRDLNHRMSQVCETEANIKSHERLIDSGLRVTRSRSRKLVTSERTQAMPLALSLDDRRNLIFISLINCDLPRFSSIRRDYVDRMIELPRFKFSSRLIKSRVDAICGRTDEGGFSQEHLIPIWRRATIPC